MHETSHAAENQGMVRVEERVAGVEDLLVVVVVEVLEMEEVMYGKCDQGEGGF